MPLIIADRVRESSSTTGTGSYTLGGALASFRAFSAVCANADTAYYTAVDNTTREWEVGLGTWSTGNTLARTTILASSNAGSAVNWGTGTRDVFLTAPAALLSTRAELGTNSDITRLQGLTGGSVTAPAITFAGDTNTGIYSPAADTIAFTEGGVESLRLDSSGNATFSGTAAMASSFLRNRIINGDMRIDQRNAGASVSVASGAAIYTLDRSGIFNGGPNAITVQRVAGAAGFQNALQVTGSASNTGVSWFQRIEATNTFDLAGVSVTFSAWVWSSAARNVGPTISTPNSFENFASQTTGGSTTWAVTTTPTRFSWTFTMPANAVNGAEVAIPLGALLAGQIVTITGVQLEVGSAATPFERRQFGTELLLCQRYFYRNNALTYFNGNSGNSNVARGGAKFGVTMRANPTITVNSSTNLAGTNGLAYVSNTNSTTTINDISGITTDGFDTIGNTGGLPSGSYIYAVSFTAAAEL